MDKTGRRNGNNFANKTAKVLLFAMLFVLVFAGTFTALIGTSTNFDTNLNLENNIAEAATSSGYYTLNAGNGITLTKQSLGAGYFAVEELYNQTTYWNGANIYDSEDGTGFYSKSPNQKDEWRGSSSVSFNINVPSYLTITSIAISGHIHVRTDGTNAGTNKDHYNDCYLDFIKNNGSTQNIAHYKPKDYGDRDEREDEDFASTLTEQRTQNQSYTVRLNSSYYKEKVGGWNKNQIESWSQLKNISISVQGYSTLPGAGTEANPFQINDRYDMRILADNVSVNRFGFADSNKYYKVMNSFDMAETRAHLLYHPTGTATNSFKGNFNGNGKTLSNVTISKSGVANVGLFGVVGGGSIYNLTLSNAKITGANSTGGFVGHMTGGTIQNVTMASGTVSGTSQVSGIIGFIPPGSSTQLSGTLINRANITGSGMVGGIVGQNHGTVQSGLNLQNYGSVTGTASEVGGIFGFADKTMSGVIFRNEGTIKGLYNVGGIMGRSQAGGISNATNLGNITATGAGGAGGEYIFAGSNVGGIIGHALATISNSTNTGNVTGASNGVGGIIGAARLGNTVGVINSTNTGSVVGNAAVGGIIGCSTGAISGVSNSGYIRSKGTVSISENQGAYLGGIAGFSSGTIENAYNKGRVETKDDSGTQAYASSNHVGGIAGYCSNTVNYSVNEGKITGSSNVGGIVGWMAGVLATSNYLYNLGDIAPGWDNAGAAAGSIFGNHGGNVQTKTFDIGVQKTAHNSVVINTAKYCALRLIGDSVQTDGAVYDANGNYTGNSGNILPMVQESSQGSIVHTVKSWSDIITFNLQIIQIKHTYSENTYLTYTSNRVTTHGADKAYNAPTSISASGQNVTATFNISSDSSSIYVGRIAVPTETVYAKVYNGLNYYDNFKDSINEILPDQTAYTTTLPATYNLINVATYAVGYDVYLKIGGNNVQVGSSIQNNAKITQLSIASGFSISDVTPLTYNGTIQNVGFTVTWTGFGGVNKPKWTFNGSTFVLANKSHTSSSDSNTSLTVAGFSQTNAGTYNFTVSADSNFTGSITPKAWTINKLSIASGFVIAGTGDWSDWNSEFNGNTQSVKFTVTWTGFGGANKPKWTFNGSTFVLANKSHTSSSDSNTSLTVAGFSQTNAGTYNFTVSADSNFKGSIAPQEWTIDPFDISGAGFNINSDNDWRGDWENVYNDEEQYVAFNVTWDGFAGTPAPKWIFSGGIPALFYNSGNAGGVAKGSFRSSGQYSATDAGTYTFKVIANSDNFTGEKSQSWTISPLNISESYNMTGVYFGGNYSKTPIIPGLAGSGRPYIFNIGGINAFEMMAGGVAYNGGYPFLIYNPVAHGGGEDNVSIDNFKLTTGSSSSTDTAYGIDGYGSVINDWVVSSAWNVSVYASDRVRKGNGVNWTTYTISVDDANVTGSVAVKAYEIMPYGSGSGTDNDPYTIEHWTQMYALSNLVNGVDSFNGNNWNELYYELTADLHLGTATKTEYETENSVTRTWDSIGTSAFAYQPIGGGYVDNNGNHIDRPFTGGFDGNNHTLSLGLDGGDNSNYGVFGTVDGADIINLNTEHSGVFNLKIDNIAVSVKGGNNTGGIVGLMESGIILNCNNSAIVSGVTNVGGVVGFMNGGTIANCTNSGNVSASGSNIGGIAGQTSGSVILAGSLTNKGKIVGAGAYVAGIVGFMLNSTIDVDFDDDGINDAIFTNGVSTSRSNPIVGNIQGSSSQVGGIFGYAGGAMSGVNFINHGAVSGTYAVGGIFGRTQGTQIGVGGSESNYLVHNYGNITASGAGNLYSENNWTGAHVGGIAGYIMNDITWAKNEGNITATDATNGNAVGGIIGSTQLNYNINISNSVNTGTISGASFVGGIVGGAVATAGPTEENEEGEIILAYAATISDSTNYGVINGLGANVGGIVGYVKWYSINSCTSAGSISGVDQDFANNVGGIAGQTLGASVWDHNITASVTGDSNVGAVVGLAVDTAMSSSAIGVAGSPITVTAKTGCAGGVVGEMQGGELNIAFVNIKLYANVTGVEYVGGIVGNVTTYGTDETEQSYFAKILMGSSYVHGVVKGNSFVGTLFGSAVAGGPVLPDYITIYTADDYNDGKSRNGYYNTIDIDTTFDSTIIANGSFGSNVGHFAGYLEGIAIFGDGIIDQDSGSITATGNNIGGFVGHLGRRASLNGMYQNTSAVKGADWVGGIIGAVNAGAGLRVASRLYQLGQGSKYAHADTNQLDTDQAQSGTITGANYVGGIIGGFKDTIGKDGYATKFLAVCQNVSDIDATGNNVGGLIGSVGAGTAVTWIGVGEIGDETDFENNNSFNGSRIVGTQVDAGGKNIGGLVGYLSADAHTIKYSYSTAQVIGSDYVGGLVGNMQGGLINNCYAGTINPTNSSLVVISSKFSTSIAGGLVANLAGTSAVQNSLSQGFTFGMITASAGGVVGFADAAASVIESLAIYITSGITEGTSCINGNGKFAVFEQNYFNYYDISNDEFMNTLFGDSTVFVLSVTDVLTDGAIKTSNSTTLRPPQQLMFWDGSGYDVSSSNEFVASNGIARLSLGNDFESFTMGLRDVVFTNIDSSPTASDWVSGYVHPYGDGDSDLRYEIDITSPTGTTGSFTISGSVYLHKEDTNGTISSDKIKIGTFAGVTYTEGSEATPYLIYNYTDWMAFVNKINAKKTYAGEYVKLMADISGIDQTSELAGDVGQGGREAGDDYYDESRDKVTKYFAGTFDGNGHTITINFGSFNTPRLSLFPNAAGATFKNLTIKGSIGNGGSSTYDIAAFVAKPFGSLSFYNCTSSVNIHANRLAAGFVGYNNIDGAVMTYVDCINTGNITTTQSLGDIHGGNGYSGRGVKGDYTYGTGGITAYINSSTTFESCKNTGNISGAMNVGGLVGKVYDNTEANPVTLTIQNSANTGNIHSWQQNAEMDRRSTSVWSNTGGLVGHVTRYARTFITASYNTGYISAVGNIVGGLVGQIGSIVEFANNDTDKPDQAVGSYQSIINYCYNTGTVKSGSLQEYQGAHAYSVLNTSWCGTVAGGLVGLVTSIEINYCYNIGDVVSNGCVGHSGWYCVVVGGLIGEARPQSDSLSVDVKYCYNAGKIWNKESKDSSAEFGGGLIGFTQNNEGYKSVTASYSMDKHFYFNDDDANEDADDWQNNGWVKDGKGDRVDAGTILTLAEMTAVFSAESGQASNEMEYADTILPMSAMTSGNNGNCFGVTSSATSILKSDGTRRTDLVNIDTTKGADSGWVYAYGCLPQLAVFAVDTQNGLSMNSVSYGQDDYGNFVEQRSGDEFSPYIIKDGVDMLGLQALTNSSRGNRHWNADNYYFEIADTSNNFDQVDVSSIDMEDYKSNNGTVIGKSHHLYTMGAIKRNDPSQYYGSVNDVQYDRWKGKNYAPNIMTNQYMSGVGLEYANFYPIGVYGEKRYFGGSFDGNNAVINNLMVNYIDKQTGSSSYAYVGLFGRVQNAEISNLTVTGTISGGVKNGIDDSGVYGGVIAYTGDSTSISNVHAGTASNQLLINAFASANNKHPKAYLGGIVGLATTYYYNNKTLEDGYKTGARLTIENCTTRANMQGLLHWNSATSNWIGDCTGSSYMGGIVGAAKGTADTFVDLVNNDNLGGLIRGSYNIGGIAGGTTKANNGENVQLLIEGCDVANVSGASFTAEGEHSVGGLVGHIGHNSVIRDSVAGSGISLIRKSDASNSADYGTAYGGIAGVSSGTVVFTGDLSSEVNINLNDSKVAKNVGGILGYMVQGSQFMNTASHDCSVVSKTKININGANSENIGGIIGLADGGVYKAGAVGLSFEGTYTIEPTLNCATADNVGGFVGQNKGLLQIPRDNITLNINTSTLQAKDNVGGFVGLNSDDGHIGLGLSIIGSSNYNGNFEFGNLADVNGVNNIGGIVGHNMGTLEIESGAVANGMDATVSGTGNNIGGIIGNSTSGSQLILSTISAVLENNGDVVGVDNVGGIIGNSAGSFESNATMTNKGNVSGNENVGGSIGNLAGGSISGAYVNGVDGSTEKGTVTGKNNVGGIIGNVGENSTVGSGEMTNYGSVTGEHSTDGATVSDGKYIGGAIGLMDGNILGASGDRTIFTNTGSVNGYSYIGGAIGAITGNIGYAEFYNTGKITAVGGDAVGGSVGAVTVGSTSIKNSFFGFTGDITAASKDSNGSTEGIGGVGGVFGFIDPANSTGFAWSNNNFYVEGDIFAIYATCVGGVVGRVESANIQIKNMLVYNNNIYGQEYVGGIVGFNGSTNNNTGLNASIVDCFNVRGVVSSNTDTSGSTASLRTADHIGGIVGYASGNVFTYKSYWIVKYTNEQLRLAKGDVLDTSIMATKILRWTDDNGQGRECDTIPTGLVKKGNLGWLDLGDALNDKFTEAYVNESEAHRQEYLRAYKARAYEKAVIDDGGTLLRPNGLNDLGVELSENGENEVWTWTDAGSDAVRYSTGNEKTGYFVAYADLVNISDSGEDYDYADEPIGSIHDVEGGDLAAWKYIANSYKAGENKPANLYSSLSYHTNSSDSEGELLNGHIYLTAFESKKDGHYLTVTDSKALQGSEENSTLISDTHVIGDFNKFYIDINAESAGNVMVFYRPLSGILNPIYNGLEREATIENNDIFDATGKTDAEIIADYTIGTRVYRIDMENSNNYGTDVGSFDIVADFFMIVKDSNGAVSLEQIGAVDSSLDINSGFKWRIQERTLEIEKSVSGNGSEYDAYNNTHYIQFVVSNIVGRDIQNVDSAVVGDIPYMKFLLESNFGTLDFDSSGSIPTEHKYVVPGTVYFQNDSGKTMTKDDVEANRYSLSSSENGGFSKVYTRTYRVYFVDAGTYNLSIKKTATNNYLNIEEEDDLVIEKRVLSVQLKDKNNNDVDNNSVNRAYDGQEQGYVITFDGWAVDRDGEIADVMDSLFAGTASTGSATCGKLMVPTSSGDKTRYPEGIWVWGIEKGDYKATVSLNHPNYELKENDINNPAIWSITTNVITIQAQLGDASGREYDRNSTVITVSVYATIAISNWQSIITGPWSGSSSESIAQKLNVETNMEEVDIEWNGGLFDNPTVITFTTGVNAGDYTITVNEFGNSNYGVTDSSINSLFEDKGEKRTLTYTIVPKEVTLSVEPNINSGAVFTYDGTYQGIKKITVDGMYPEDSLKSSSMLTVSCSSNPSNLIKVVGDHEVEFKNNSSKLGFVGSYTVTVKDADKNYYFEGHTFTRTWSIVQKKLTLSPRYANSGVSGQYIYTSEHLGLEEVEVSGLYDDLDEVMAVTVAGEDLEVGRFTTDSVLFNGAINVGEYSASLTVENAGKSKSGNYYFDGDEKVYEWTITPRELTVGSKSYTAKEDNRYIYTSEHLGLKKLTISGVQGNEPLSTVVDITFTNNNPGGEISGYNVTYSDAINVGEYTTVINSINDNYTLEFNESWTIDKRAITIESDPSQIDENYTYQNQHLGLEQAIADGIVGSDNFQGLLDVVTTGSGLSVASYSTDKVIFDGAVNVGTYTVTITLKDSADNYLLSGDMWSIEWAIGATVLSVDDTASTYAENLTEGDELYTYTSTHLGLHTLKVLGIKGDDTLASIIDSTGLQGGLRVESFSESTDTITFDGAINVGTYRINDQIIVSKNPNYIISGDTWSDSWTILKKGFTLTIGEGADYVYDGEKKTVTATANVPGDTLAGFVWNNDIISIKVLYTRSLDGLQDEFAVNAGSYTVGNGEFSAIREGQDATGNYEVVVNQNENNIINIAPRKIKVSWTGSSFVYTGYPQGPSLAILKIMNDTGDEEIASNEITSNSGAGIMESERIAFELVNATLTNVGTQTASALISSVTGSNDGGNTEIDNYFLEAEETEKSFSINKSRVELSLEGVLEKVYDATNLGDKELLTYRFVSTNGGASDASIVVEELTYASINVGANILVTAKVRLTSTGNYTLNNSTVSGSIGTITARNITVSLYLKNGKAEKTYDGSNVFATASSTNGDTSVRSEKYKIGFGMTVSDLPTAEISGGVIVNGIFREVLDTRRDLDSYINNVLRSGTENNYRYSMTSGMFKALEFSLDGTRKGNYTFSIDDYSTAETAFDESVILRDSRDTDAGDDSDTSSKIAEINILQKYVNAKYQNAVQSYANDDNSYNTNWVAVTGNVPTVGDDSIQVDVFNGWMFVNGQDGEKKEIKRYTRTQGKVDNSTGLGAKLSSDDGRDLNYKLRNQPVLVVGYFVVPDESDGDAFKIGSLAGLMLASHYYNLSFVENDPDAPLATEEVYVTFTPNDEWKVDGVVYETFELYLDAEQEKLREEYGQDDILIEYFSDMGDSGEYGYYYLKPITMISYVDFKLTDNISGIMSYDDMRILSGEFGDNWGKGNSYLQNFLQTEVGEHVTAVGAVFTENFIGSFNGNGYVIDGMNLVHVGGGNVGMFASVGTGSLPNSEEVKSGSVKELHMRNFNITVYHTSGGSLNVGGIIGHMDSNQPLVELSYHGKIKVTSYVGTVNVGGIIGSVSATESISGLLAKAYVLGNIEVDAMAGNVGGVIGSMQNAGSVSGVVSTIEVFANGSGLSVGALIGQSSDTSVIDSSAVAVYLGNSVWANNSAISKLIGNGATSAGITYDTFRSGSTTGYGTNGYVGVDGGQVAGEYDIMTDYNAGLSAKSRYSTRMIDIFDTYVLGHTTSQIDWVDDPQVKVYQKTNSSVWLGATLGTSADPIVLRYAGQIALLSMFRFATFTLANDIKMPNSYYGTASSGAFYGTVNAGANKIIINSNNTEQTLFENETGNLSDSILKFV